MVNYKVKSLFLNLDTTEKPQKNRLIHPLALNAIELY